MIQFRLDAEKKGVAVSEYLYGLFFEDINQAADGGLNAEMVVNNSFEYAYFSYDDLNCESPVEVRRNETLFWEISGSGAHRISREGGMNPANPTYLLLEVGGYYRLENRGYHACGSDLYGMTVEQGETYHFSMFVKRLGFEGRAKVFLADGRETLTTVCEIGLKTEEGDWRQVCGELSAKKSGSARLYILLEGEGTLGIDYVSLLPENTWGNPDRYRNGKLSPRLVQAIKDCHPSFLRFPGGCVVEGDVAFEYQYRWRNTVGPLEQRRQIPNLWRYMQSYAIGFYEYFMLCEDVGAAALPVVHCGVLCQIRMGEQRKTGYRRLMPGTEEFQREVVDNVAELFYFAKGNADSEDEKESYWASIRAEMGHSEPFELKFVGIGNENWGREYFENLDACLIGLRNYRYCGRETDLLQRFGITVVTTCGVDIRPSDNNPAWKTINERYRECIVDEHVYHTAQWFFEHSKRYDGYDRQGAKVLAGEYAVHTLSDGRGRLNGENNLRSALAEAAFLTGCERNSDVVKMTCYAPLFASTFHYRWTPDLIWFNARDVMFTPNYYVQKMFAENVGETTLTDVMPDDGKNAGGLTFGACRTRIAVSSVEVRDLATGKTLYRHDFKDGTGGWKVCPRGVGGKVQDGALIVEAGKSFNGFYYDAETFENCEVEIAFKRLGGEQSFIAGVGVSDVRDAGTSDCVGFSICCHYGKNRDGYRVAYEKRSDFMRVDCEETGAPFSGYEKGGDRMKLVYTRDLFAAYLLRDGKWRELVRKTVWKVNGRIFQSATVGKDGTVYLKVVNASERDEPFEAELSHFGKRERARITTLFHEDDRTVNEIGEKSGVKENVAPTVSELPVVGNRLSGVLKKNSVNVFVIE